MKIIYLHQYFKTPAMSGATRSYELAKRLVAAGHEVHMITSRSDVKSPKNKIWQRETIAGINVHWYPVPYSNYFSFWRRIVAFLCFAFIAARRSAAIGGDIIFATSTPLTIAIPAVYAARRSGVPMIFEVRDLWPEIPIKLGIISHPIFVRASRIFEGWVYRNSDRIVALSPGMARGIARRGYPGNKIIVIPNGADLELFQPNETNAKTAIMLKKKYPFLSGDGIKLVVYTGTIGRVNNVRYMAKIAREMGKLDPLVCFVVVGEGHDRKEVLESAANLRVLGKNFWLLPPLSKNEIPGVLSLAVMAVSFFIDVQALWHNSANKFFDALAAGKPILINYQGWQADILENTGAGLVVPPDDALLAAHMLKKFLNKENGLDVARESALKLAMEGFDRDKLAEKFQMLLEETYLSAS